jgi:Carboxypeptidase regulatory-like domain/TonB dependent receptor/TonB-dependent Receptor Plug Domain
MPKPRSLFVLFVTLCFPIITLAQSSTATLSGTVEDQTGAIVAGANIALVNVAQGSQRLATSNNDGRFVFPALPPGQYSVTATREGFAPVEVKNVALNVNDQVALRITLVVGEISQSVEVLEGTALINESAEVATVVDRQFVANLPLNGRSFQSLLTLTPGVVQTRVSSNDLGQFSVNGQRADANYFTVDGVSANTAMSGTANQGQTLGGTLPGLTVFGGTNNLVSVDALEEFKVLTSSYAAEFGRSPGAQVSIVTRSGTNDFHGALFDYLRNNLFDANDWFTNRNRLAKPPLRQNDFGGVFHGPIFLPRFGEGGRQPWYNGRNHSFFFFSYEGLRLRQPQVISNAEVPSLNLRQTALSRIQPYLNAFPVPNGADLGNGLAQFSAGYSIPATLNATSIRIDQTFSNKFTLFSRYNHAPSETTSRAQSQLSSPRTVAFRTRTFTIGTTYLPTSSANNDFRINYSDNKSGAFLILDDFGGAVPVAESALFPPFASPVDSQVAFTLAFGGRPELRVGSTTASIQRQWNVIDTLSLLVGQHQFKFGLDYRRLNPTFSSTRYFQQAAFSNATAVRTASVSSLGLLANRDAKPRFQNFSAFGQDTWRANQRLTLTYGLRWEINPAPRGADGNDAFTASGIDNPATITLEPQGTPLYHTSYLNLAPRLGIAYRLSRETGRETVLRAGAGVFYDMGNGQSTLGFTLPPFSTGFLAPAPTNVPYPLTLTAAQPPPFPNPPFAFVAAFDPDLKLPRTYQWNVAVERSLGAAQTVSASYVAALGRELISLRRLVNPNPTFVSVQIVRNEASSDYHALQLQFQRRLSHGLQALASYTWSHSLDDASSDFGFGLDHGSSDFDLRHSFSAATTYDIPAPRSPFARAILGNWSVDTIVRIQSATPVDLIARSFFNVLGETVNVRPDLISGTPIYINDPKAPGGKLFNRAAFAIPSAGRQGTLGRNVMRGFSLKQTDFSLRRKFAVNERVSLLFRADIFNVFNHPNFADPINSLSSGSFGQSTQTFGKGLGSGTFGAGLSPLYQSGGARSMQFSFKAQF